VPLATECCRYDFRYCAKSRCSCWLQTNFRTLVEGIEGPSGLRRWRGIAPRIHYFAHLAGQVRARKTTSTPAVQELINAVGHAALTNILNVHRGEVTDLKISARFASHILRLRQLPAHLRLYESQPEKRSTMNIFLKAPTAVCGLIVMSLTVVTANAQRFDITPLVGGAFGGTMKLDQQGASPNVEAHLEDSWSFGIAGGVRIPAEDCEACGLIEFRWMRQNTHIGLKQDLLVPTPVSAATFRPAVTLDHYLGDFTYEWTIPDAQSIKPFATLSLGAARLSTPASSATRFVFGIGTGIKVFPKPHWGFRLQVEYLPIVMHASVQQVVCAGGCVVALGGGLLNQFQASFGPTFRF